MSRTTPHLLFLFSLAFAACSEAPLIGQDVLPRLNRPGAMALVPDTDFALVVNTNIDIREKSGSIIAVNLATRSVIPESLIVIPNLAGRIVVDGARKRVFVADRAEEGLLVYSYSVPGPAGEPIALAPVNVPTPTVKSTNAVQIDKGPFDIYEALGTPKGDRLFVDNSQDGTVSIVDPDSLETTPNLNPYFGDLTGLPLISSANFQAAGSLPGRGAGRMSPTPDKTLLFITSTLSNSLYVLGTSQFQVQGMMDLSAVSSAPGTRDIAISPSGLAYVSHRGLGSILVLDVSEVREDGVNFKVLEPKILAVIPAGRGIDALAFSSDGKKLYATDNVEDTLSVIDLTQRVVTASFHVGSLPSEIVKDTAPSRNTLYYVLNLLSDSISVIDEADMTKVAVTIP
jgi:YVTN family beta-propeller protein